jgi:hypothetical protein
MNKMKKAIWIVGIFIVVLLCTLLGSNNIRYEPIDYNNVMVVKEIARQKLSEDDEFVKKSAELDNVEIKLNELQGKIDKAEVLIVDVEDYKKATVKIKDLKIELRKIEHNVYMKEFELESYDEKIEKAKVKVKSRPKTLGAGQHVVGRDITSGRYSVTGTSNFFVYNKRGSLKVNTILGSNGVSQYTCNLSNGDNIRAESKVYLTPLN